MPFEDPIDLGPITPQSLPAFRPGVPRAPAPSAPSVGGHSDSGRDRFAQLLKLVLPALAATYALKKGSGLGSYADGLMRGQSASAEQADHVEQRRIQRDQIARQTANDSRAEAREHRLDAERIDEHVAAAQQHQAAVEAAKQQSIHTALQHALDKAAENPGFMAKVNKAGPENFAIVVPGLGNVNLKDAFERLGVVHGQDGYEYGHPPAVEKTPLITGYGEDGKTPTRVPDAKGVKVYERPRAPKEPAKATKRAYTWKDDDPDSDTFGKSFRIIEDEDGKVISKQPVTGVPAPMPSHASTTPTVGGTKIGRFTVTEKK